MPRAFRGAENSTFILEGDEHSTDTRATARAAGSDGCLTGLLGAHDGGHRTDGDDFAVGDEERREELRLGDELEGKSGDVHAEGQIRWWRLDTERRRVRYRSRRPRCC